MAYSEGAQIITMIAGTTFADGDLYKFLDVDTDGKVILMDTTGNNLSIGTLYGRTRANDLVKLREGDIAVPTCRVCGLPTNDANCTHVEG